MYAILCYDTEDVYYPPEYHIDDIDGWLSETMTRYGVRGTFCVTREKACSLEARGRKDVIEAMMKHDIVSHQWGNLHPLIPEILQDKGWQDGMQAMRQFEDAVREDFQRIYGRPPVGFSRHNDYFGPQHVGVAGERGLPYLYLNMDIEGWQQPFWYAGALTFDSPAFDEFDGVYSCDAAFEKALEDFKLCLRQCQEQEREYLTLFGSHPVRIMARGWLEHYCLASGMTRTPQELGWVYAVRSEAEEKRARVNFERLMKFLQECPDLQVVGMEEAGRLFSGQPAEIQRDELTEYAEAVVKAARPVLHRTFSPAELLCGLAESLVRAESAGDVPYSVERRNVLGPASRPVVGMELDTVTQAEVITLCKQLLEHVKAEGCLAANLSLPAGRIGIGQLLLLAARSYLALARYEKYERLRVAQTPRYPDVAQEFTRWVYQFHGEHWGLPLDFSCEKIAEQARLQSWTLKPAWLNPPRRPAYDEGRLKLRGNDA